MINVKLEACYHVKQFPGLTKMLLVDYLHQLCKVEYTDANKVVEELKTEGCLKETVVGDKQHRNYTYTWVRNPS